MSLCGVSGFTDAVDRKYPQLFVAKNVFESRRARALRLGAVVACEESLALVRRAMRPSP